jgi:hypothetical protein
MASTFVNTGLAPPVESRPILDQLAASCSRLSEIEALLDIVLDRVRGTCPTEVPRPSPTHDLASYAADMEGRTHSVMAMASDIASRLGGKIDEELLSGSMNGVPTAVRRF